MGLAKLWCVVRRHLWLQSLRRHFLPTAFEVLSVVMLAYYVVPSSAPAKAALQEQAKSSPIIGVAAPAYRLRSRRVSVVYGPSNIATDALVQTGFQKIIGNSDIIPIANRSDVLKECLKQWSNTGIPNSIVCVEFFSLGPAGNRSLAYRLHHLVDAKLPAQFPLASADSFRLERKDPSNLFWEDTLDEQERLDYAYLISQKAPHYVFPPLLLRALPEVPPAEDVRNFRATTVVLTMSIYCIPFMRRIAAVTAELSTGLKNQQRMYGLSLPEFWFGHFLSAFAIQMFESCAVMAFMVYLRNVDEESTFFRHVDITLLAFVMVVFNTCHIVTAMLIAAVCINGRSAMFAGVILGFLIPSFDNAVTFGKSGSLSKFVLHNRSSKLRTAIYPQIAGSEVLRTLAIFDDYEGGAGWDVLFKRAMGLDSVTLFELLSVMIGVCAVSVFLLFYLSNVLPWATEYPLHPVFCLMVFGHSTALDGISLKIYALEVTVLVGPNGAGKTTLMSVLAESKLGGKDYAVREDKMVAAPQDEGFLKPTSGSIKIGGSDEEAVKSTAFCPQMDVLFPDLTVVEHITYYGQRQDQCVEASLASAQQLQGQSRDLLSKTVSETLHAMQLLDNQHAFPDQLSGGMRRRLSLSISLVAKPKILVLDEPTTGMDPETWRSIWDLVGSLRESSTILLSTHDMEEADVLADRIVMMKMGKLLCAGSPAFLKKACGVGYTIHVSTKSQEFEVADALDIIRQAAPNAVIKEATDDHVSITLHTLEHNGFVAMFRKLEEQSKKLGIKSFGVTVATMTDAYITINKLWVPQGVVDVPKPDARSGQGTQQESVASCAGAVVFHSSDQRVRALFTKRLLYWTRSPLATLAWVLKVALFFLWCAALKAPPAAEPVRSFNVSSRAQFGGARYFLQAPRETDFSRNFERLARLEGATVTRMQDAQQELVDFARKDFVKYYSHYAYGFVDNGFGFEGWYNPASPVSRNVLLNLLGTAMLRASSNSPQARISAQVSFHHTRERVHSLVGSERRALEEMEKLKSLIANNNDFWTGWPAAVLGLAACIVVSFPVTEKLSGARDLQLMTGISGARYVASHFVFDLLLQYLVPFGVCFTIYAFWYANLEITTAAALYVIMLAFAPVAIFEPYLVAHLFDSESGAYCCVFAMLVVAAPITFMAYQILRSRVREWWLRPVFMLSAPFALNEAALNAVNLEPAAQLCAALYARVKEEGPQWLENHCRQWTKDSPYLGACCTRILKKPSEDEVYAPGAFSLSAEGILPDVVYFLCQGVLLFIVLSVLHSGYAAKAAAFITGGAGKPSKRREDSLDQGVREENELAKRLASSGAPTELEREGHTLVACDLQKTFAEFKAVRGISLALRRAECLGILGMSGAGKSTIFRMLAGLLQPSAGEAYMRDVILSASPRTWQSFIGYCPQSNAFLEKLSAFENLRLLAQLRGIAAEKISGAVRASIELTDLESQAFKPCGLYSGGNKRKLSVALSILGNHRVVFLDEPFAGIDVVARDKISASLSAIRTEAGTAIVLTSQGMEECEALCERVCIMVAGQMACLGTMHHLKHKYGTGYTLQLVLKPKPVSPDHTGAEGDATTREKIGRVLHRAVTELFPDVHILEAHDNVHDCQITKKLPWSTMFEKIEGLEQSFTFSRVLIQDTNLQQILFGFARSRGETGRT